MSTIRHRETKTIYFPGGRCHARVVESGGSLKSQIGKAEKPCNVNKGKEALSQRESALVDHPLFLALLK